MDDNQLYLIRPTIAEIIEAVARDGLPGPRDLDVALDAIFCAFNEGPIAAAEAERDIAMEKAAEAYREFDAHQQAGQLMASQCELVNAEREAAEARAAKAEAAIDRALQLFDPDYPDNPIRPQDRGEKAAQQVLRAAIAASPFAPEN